MVTPTMGGRASTVEGPETTHFEPPQCSLPLDPNPSTAVYVVSDLPDPTVQTLS